MAYLDEPPERPLRVQIVGCIGGTQRLIPDSLPVLQLRDWPLIPILPIMTDPDPQSLSGAGVRQTIGYYVGANITRVMLRPYLCCAPRSDFRTYRSAAFS
jgi:hypothetical protein